MANNSIGSNLIASKTMAEGVQVEEPASVTSSKLGGARSLHNQNEPSAFSLTPPVVLMKGANDPTFIISFRSQKEFVGALAWKSAGMIWGGSAIILLGLYMLLAQMGLIQLSM